MLRPYVELLGVPGARVFCAGAFVARMPMAMMSLGIVLLVAGVTGRYAVAGTLAGAYALVNAVTGPLIARFVDRRGQRRVLVPIVCAHAVSVLGFIAAVSLAAPVWTWFAAAAAGGAAAPPVGSLVRARWGHVLGPGRRLQTAYSFESVLDELIFVIGPLLVAVLATRVERRAGLLAALACVVAGAAVLVRHRSSEPPPVPHDPAIGGSLLRARGMAYVVVVMLFIGGVFGGVEISAVAFADERDRPSLAGPLLACYALGSMLAGLMYGVVHWQMPLARRFLLGTGLMTVTVAVLPFVRGFGALAVALFVAGIGIAPTLISGLSLVERIVPSARVTEGLTWATTGIIVGLALASSIAGSVVDRAGASPAFTVAVGSGAAAVAICLLGYRRLAGPRRAEPAAASPSR